MTSTRHPTLLLTTGLLALAGATAAAQTASDPAAALNQLQSLSEMCAALPDSVTARELTGWRAWLQTTPAAILFTLLTIATIVLAVIPKSPLRRAVTAGLKVIAQHKRLYIGTLAVLGALFAMGVITGTRLPDECRTAVLQTVTTAVDNTGASAAYAKNMATAATVTFTQNFVVVSLTTLGGTGLILGAPAYLIGAFSFYTQGIPFGLLIDQPLPQLLFVITLLLIELVAYFSVIAGAGMLLRTVFTQGFEKYLEGVKKLGLMLVLAAVTLMFGAWYEPIMLALLG